MRNQSSLWPFLIAVILTFFISPFIHAVVNGLVLDFWRYHHGDENIIVAVIMAYIIAYLLPFLLFLSYINWLMKMLKIANARNHWL